eukprot:403344775
MKSQKMLFHLFIYILVNLSLVRNACDIQSVEINNNCYSCQTLINGCFQCHLSNKDLSSKQENLVCDQCVDGLYLFQNTTSMYGKQYTFTGTSSLVLSNNGYLDQSGIIQSCVPGYYQNYQNQCQQCQVTKCKMCEPLTGLSCSLCEPYYYFQAGTNTCQKCNKIGNINESCVSCDETQCFACDNGYLFNGQCINNCPEGFYGVKEYSKFGQVQTSRCQKCSNDCKNCIGPDSNQCISCQRNFYLKLSIITINPTLQGQCLIKPPSNSLFEISLFVKPQESTIPISQQNGSLNNPFDNIYNAFVKAQEISAPYQQSIINIFLLKGDHYLLRNMTANYIPRDTFDNDNLNIQIIIQPFYCQANESIDPTLCYDDLQSQIVLFNKMRSNFAFEIYQSLELRNILVDSLDSSIDLFVQKNYQCLFQRQKCCSFNSQNIPICGNDFLIDIMTKLPTNLCIFSDQGEVFKFKTSTSANLQYPQKLTLNINQHVDVLQRNINTNQNSIDVSIIQHRPFNCSLDNFDDLQQSCFLINITQSNYTNSDYMKEAQSVVTFVNTNLSSIHFSLVVDLKNYPGSIVITNNNFENNQIQVKDCSVNQKLEHNFQLALHPEIGLIQNQDNIQFRHLISVIDDQYSQNKSGQIILINNRFFNNTAVKGLVYLGVNYREQNTPIIIYGNSFIRNAAYYGASALYIRVRAKPDALYDSFNQSSIIDEKSQPCGGVNVVSNYYEKNHGCAGLRLNVVQILCMPFDTVTDQNDVSILKNFTNTPEDRLRYQSYALSNQTLQYTESYQVNVFDTQKQKEFQFKTFSKQVRISENIYLNNYAGGESAILAVGGMWHFNLQNEYFKDNGDIFDEKYLELGGLIKSTGIYTFTNQLTKTTTMVGQILIGNMYNVTFTNITFDGGLKLRRYLLGTMAQNILIKQCIGPLQLFNITFMNQHGMGTDPSILDDAITTTQRTQTLPWIGFQSTYLASLIVSGLTIINATIVGIKDSTSYVDSAPIIDLCQGQYQAIHSSDYFFENSLAFAVLEDFNIQNLYQYYVLNWNFPIAAQNFTIPGLFGVYHIVPTATLENKGEMSLEVLIDCNISDFAGGVLQLFKRSEDLVQNIVYVNYIVRGNLFLNWKTWQQKYGGMYFNSISYFMNVTYLNNQFKNLSNNIPVSNGMQGVVAYLYDYSHFISRNNVYWNTSLDYTGSVIFLYQRVRTIVNTVTFENDTFFLTCYLCTGVTTKYDGIFSYGIINGIVEYGNLYVYSKNNYFTSSNKIFSTNGAVFSLVATDKYIIEFYDNNSTYVNLTAQQGPVLYCQGCQNTVIENSRFENISSTQHGGSFYFIDNYAIKAARYQQNLTLRNITVKNSITSGSGGFIFSQSLLRAVTTQYQ